MGVPEKLAERMSMAEQHEYLRARFSRRNLMRGGAVTLGAVTGGAFVPGAVARAAAPTQSHTPSEYVDGALVAPFGRHLAFGNDPRTEMTISWQVPVAVKKPFIRVGAHPGTSPARSRPRSAASTPRPASARAATTRSTTCTPG